MYRRAVEQHRKTVSLDSGLNRREISNGTLVRTCYPNSTRPHDLSIQLRHHIANPATPTHCVANCSSIGDPVDDAEDNKMQKTRALRSLRNIFPPIHQPLPLNKRESDRLLEALKASFRNQLEQDYGFSPDSVKPELLAKPAITYLTPDNAPHNSARATDQHLLAIVSSPFLGGAGKNHTATTTPTTATRPSTAESSLEKHKIAFSRAVQRGLMNPQLAAGFLFKLKAEVSQSATLSVADTLRRTGAGSLVLEWLRMSGKARDLSFLAHSQLTRQLVSFLLLEGRDDVVWAWIERLTREGPALEQAGAVANVQERVTNLVDQIVSIKSQDRGLDGTFEAVLRADALRRESQLPGEVVRPAWHQAVFHSTVDAFKHARLSVPLFDRFVAAGRELRPRMLAMAHLKLHRPVDPSAELAVRYLSDDRTWKRLSEPDKQRVNMFEKRLSLLGVDTVQHLMHVDEVKEASRIYKLLRTHFPAFQNTPAAFAF